MRAIDIAQIVIPVIVIALVLIQDRSSGIGGIFGGGGESFYQKRRGLENVVLLATAFFIVLFVILSILKLVL